MIHGWGCRTRTFPTKCRHCQAKVFFFSCDCGSAVFFDHLGPPWPVHPCGEEEDDPYAPSKPNTSFVPLKDRLVPVQNRLKGPFTGIEEDLVQRATAKAEDHPILAINAEGKSKRTIVGEVRELRLDVNPFNALGIPDTDVGHKMLNVLATEPMGRITVHAPASTRGEHRRESFTAWAATALIRASGAVRGVLVAALLEGITVPVMREGAGMRADWYCKRLELL